MNRKKFLSSIFAAGAAIPALGSRLPEEKVSGLTLVPPYLRPGDTIGITCPAGAITERDILPALGLIESWGFKTMIGATIGQKDFTFGGTDEERTKDLQSMLDDPHPRDTRESVPSEPSEQREIARSFATFSAEDEPDL